MYPDWSGPALAGFFVLWLGILSFLSLRQNQFLKSLFPRSGERDIRKKFEEIVKLIEGFRNDLTGLDSKILMQQKEGVEHLQRIKLLRFNPYGDTGGDQSFTACFLNQVGSGVVLTSLHARSGTRVFGKEVLLGKGLKYKLSKEEEMVVKEALKQNE